jgi:hypothetical protein
MSTASKPDDIAVRVSFAKIVNLTLRHYIPEGFELHYPHPRVAIVRCEHVGTIYPVVKAAFEGSEPLSPLPLRVSLHSDPAGITAHIRIYAPPDGGDEGAELTTAG